MRLIFCVLSVIFTMFCISCKNENKSSEIKAVESKAMEVPSDYAMMNQDDISEASVNEMRQQALAVLHHRQKEQNNKSYTIVDKDFWSYEATVKDSDFNTGEKVAGKWIDFHENLTYEYGDYGDRKGGGHYFFNLETKKLLMVDDHPAIKPQEFDVKLTDQMLVLVGESVYKDNNLQAKLVRISAKPSK
ncbi:MAG: hypothetical protein IPM42_01745 [Saprospiraceae bacterium]|nr:hypothetical protein [Saprospiraceae bacterium]